MKRFLQLSLLLIAFTEIKAQTAPPCPNPPPPGAPNCQAACVYCNFDGYMGVNNGTPSGGAPICGQISLHNDQWFGFVAGSTSITLNIATSNCVVGDGLQVAFFESCSDDAIVCNPGQNGGGGLPLELSYNNFIEGQTYYLMIDGYIGDVCDYEIEVLSGSVTPPPPQAPPVPSGPSVVCPGATVVYSVPELFGVGYYTWTAPNGSSINGLSNNVTLDAPEGNTVTITFGTLGGNVCVRVGNDCNSPLVACKPVVNQPIQPTPLPEVVVCYEDLPYVWDQQPSTPLSNPGVYNLQSNPPYESYLGCDSSVRQTIRILSQIRTNLNNVFVCEGSCFSINGNDYCNAGGPFVEVFTAASGCDSIVQFNIVKIPANAVIQPITAIDCTNPSVVLNSAGSTSGGGITYTWSNTSWTSIGNGATQTVNTGGTYHLVVYNPVGTGCRDTATVTISASLSPPGAMASGGNITCVASAVALSGSSPTAGVTYQWSGPGITVVNQNQQNPIVNQQGTYVLTVTNPVNGCTSSANATVTVDNTPPTISAAGGTITCSQASITIDGMSNAGTPGYVWAGPGINAGNQSVENPVVSVPGTYTVTVTNNANGCTNTANATVAIDQNNPAANAGNDQTITCLQPNVTLNGSGNAGGAGIQFNWSGPGITPANQNVAAPVVSLPGNYILTVQNNVNGCSDQDTVAVDEIVVPPLASAGSDQVIDCANTSVTLQGAGSSQGANFGYSWAGPGITPANQNLQNPTVNASGTYTLQVTNNTTGCTATDVVDVQLNQTPPTADAGADLTLTCSLPNGIALNGAGTPAAVTFLWSGPGTGANNETQQNPIVTQPGLYTLITTNPANGCTAQDQVDVFQDANVPTANAGNDLTLNCTTTTVDLNGSASSTGPTFSYTWSGPGITPANNTLQSPIGISMPGTYALTVTNSLNGCENSDIVIVLIDTITPAATAGPDLILNCYNNGTDTLDASVVNTGASFSFLWSGPGITPANQNMVKPVVNMPGVYNLIVTNTDNTCTTQGQVTVSDDQVAPTADAGADQTIDCVNTLTTLGGASSSGIDITYTWTGPGITPANMSLPMPVVTTPGAYSLLVTNNLNGCTAQSAVTVNTNAVFPIAGAGPDGVLTCTNPQLSLDGTGSSSGANIQIMWTGPGITPANQSQVSPMVGLSGNYILAVTDLTNSCTARDTAFLDLDQVNPQAIVPVSYVLNCQTLAVTLDGSSSSTGANITYQWNGAGITPVTATLQSPVVNLPDVYTLLVTNTDNGCTASVTTTVLSDVATPIADAGLDSMLTCTNPAINLNGSGSDTGAGFLLTWVGPDINSNNVNQVSPLVSISGNYQLIVTNLQNQCTDTDMVFVGEDQLLPITAAGADQTIDCNNPIVLLDGALSQTGPNIAYNWSGPGILPGQSPLVSPQADQPGMYTLVVTNLTNGCSNTDFVEVLKNTVPPIADAGNPVTLTCANSTTGVSLVGTGSSAGTEFTYSWSGPGITPANQMLLSPTVLVTGQYSLMVTDTLNGCTATDVVDVLQDQNLPTADAGADQTITCANPDVVIDGSGSTSPGGLIQYEWSGPGILPGSQNEPAPTVSSGGIYTLTIINPSSGCQASDNVDVLLDVQPPQLSTTSDTITCQSPQGNLSVSSSLLGSTYLWEGPGINNGNRTLPNPVVGAPGLYSVTVTGPNGCTASASVVMEVSNDFPDGTAEGALLNCLNNSMATISGVVNTPGASAQWLNPNGTVLTNNTSAMVTQPGIYTFEITAPNGCKRPIQVEVEADFAVPQVVAQVSDILDCNTTTVSISGAGSSVGSNFNYFWTSADGNIVSGANTLNPVVDEAGTYQLLVLNTINGCRDSTDILVSVDPTVPVGFNLNVRDIRCFGEDNGQISVLSVVSGTEPFAFTLNNAPAVSTPQFSNLPAGNYLLTLEDANGCLLDTLIKVSEPDELIVDLGPDVTVQLGEPVDVTAQLAYTTPLAGIVWNYAPNCDSSGTCAAFTYTPLQSYNHLVTVTDVNGCSDADDLLITVSRKRLVYVPNVFTPDSDNPANAILMINGGVGIVKVKQWLIFDRWGNAVFQVQNILPNTPSGAWDGTIRGDKGATGVYTWFAEIEFIDGVTETFKGDVTLLR